MVAALEFQRADADGLEAERLMTQYRLADQIRTILRLARLLEEARILRRGDTAALTAVLAGPRRLAQEDGSQLHRAERAP